MSAPPPLQCNSPEGMGQLIKYFESQSQRLDRQMVNPQPSSLCSNFESLIKFNGVPILPPAMTQKRREELRQIKKDAVLLEKRLKARRHRQLLSSDKSKLSFPDTSPRPTARQLNFDSGSEAIEAMQDRQGATNPVSLFAVAETHLGAPEDEFGLQTMDSVNSDFMSMEQSSVPRVFAGLALTSFKEQKISYDLDRLSKVLNVQDMASTSGSDISDALGNTQQVTVGEDALIDAQRLAQKFIHNNNAASDSRSFCHESQDTVVEVSPEGGTRDTSSTSGFVDNQATSSSNLEQTQTSVGSSPGCGSASTTGTTDSQRSNRSSPKSFKNAVHFASFLTEYNTSSSQLFERPTIVKKKMPHEQSVEAKITSFTPNDIYTPIIGDPSEARQRNHQRSTVDTDGAISLLNRVALNLDSDASPITPPFEASSGVPFQNYGRPEPYSSDKENEGSHSHQTSVHNHKKSPDRPGRSYHSHSDQGSGDRWATHKKSLEKKSQSKRSPEAGSSRGDTRDESRRKISSHSELHRQPYSLPVSGVSSGIGHQALPGQVDHVGASLPVSSVLQSESAESVVGISTKLSAGLISSGQTSVSDSQSSGRAVLTRMSDSSSTTIRDSGNLAMNIVVGGHGSASMDSALEEKHQSGSGPASKPASNSEDKSTAIVTEEGLSHSPKKLNTDCDVQPSATEEHNEPVIPETPPGNFVRKGSYTLSKPSPALLKMRAKLREEEEKQALISNADKQQDDTKPADSSVAQDSSSSTELVSAVSRQEQQGRVPRKLPNVQAVTVKPQVQSDSISESQETEKEGKAEHINKYLSQVQFQNSMNLSCQSWDATEEQARQDDVGTADVDAEVEMIVQDPNDEQGQESIAEDDSNLVDSSSMLEALKSLAESMQGSEDHSSVVELLTLHQQQMERERQALINQQQRDMEELFVQQRREMMLLETEIKAAQQMEKEQQDFLVQNLPENIKVMARNHADEFSPLNTGNLQTESMLGGGDALNSSHHQLVSVAINSVNNRRPQSIQHRGPSVPVQDSPSSPSEEFSLPLQPKSFPGAVQVKPVHKAKKTSPYPLLKKSKVSPYSPRSAWESTQSTHVKTLYDDSLSPRMPYQSPSTSSPRIHRPLMVRSPVKSTPARHQDLRVVIPPEANRPEMQRKFERVSAVAKGFLTRCLLRSDKVQELIKTIKDTREFAFKFQTETPVKKGVFTPQDRALLERIVAQLQAALLDIHDIFFEIPRIERMTLIEQTRFREQDRRVKMSRDSLRGSGPRISQATLKALERKRKAREAEASMDASTSSTSRPNTAPAATSTSPRCQSHMDIRALKPLQGQGHRRSEVISSKKPESGRQDKERPRTAPSVKQLTRPKRITALGTKQTNSQSSTSPEVKVLPKDGKSNSSMAATKTVTKSKSASSIKPVSSRPGKSWR